MQNCQNTHKKGTEIKVWISKTRCKLVQSCIPGTSSQLIDQRGVNAIDARAVGVDGKIGEAYEIQSAIVHAKYVFHASGQSSSGIQIEPPLGWCRR